MSTESDCKEQYKQGQRVSDCIMSTLNSETVIQLKCIVIKRLMEIIGELINGEKMVQKTSFATGVNKRQDST